MVVTVSDISVPGFGKQKKQTVYVIGGIVVAVIGIGYYRSKKSAAAATTAASTTATDTSSTDTTGSGYVDPNAYGAGSAGAANGYQYDPTTGQYDIPSGQPLYGGTSQPGGFTSNSQWSQAAEEYLAGTVGLDATAVQAALGKYITGGNVTADQQNIIEQAIAAEGYPPQSGPNGYPPSIKLVATTPAPPAAASNAGSGTWIRNVATGAIYQVVGKTIYHLTPRTFDLMIARHEAPHYVDVSPADPRLRYHNGGNI